MNTKTKASQTASDVREQILADCVELIPFANASAKALACHDLRKLKSLYTSSSQKRVIAKLKRLVDDLGRCRTLDDLPGPCAEVEELRNTSLEVFRGLTEYAGDPFGLTTAFRNGAVEFFHGLLTRDPVLLARVRKRHERSLAATLLTCAITLMGLILSGLSIPATLLATTSGLLGAATPSGRKSPSRGKRVTDGAWMVRECEDVLAWANDPRKNPDNKLPHEVALAVWRYNKKSYEAASKATAAESGYRNAKSLRAHFYPLRVKFEKQRLNRQPYTVTNDR